MPGRWQLGVLAAAAIAIVDVGPANGQGFDREVAFLSIPSGARVVGMGRAATALAGEPQSLRWNPAVLASIREVSPLISHYDGPLDFRVNQLAVGAPAGKLGVLALSVEVQSFGSIPVAGPASPEDAVGEISPSNVVLGVTFARTVVHRLSLGITAKWIRSELIEDLSGNTYAFDAGLLWHPVQRLPLDVGLSFLNVGPGLRLGNGPGVERDPLPGRLRLGAGYDVLRHLGLAEGIRLLLTAEIEHALRDLATGSQYLGAELGIREILFVRSGFIAETLIETNTGVTVGAGLALGAFRFDLARELGVNQLGDETHVSLSAHL